MFSIEKLIKAPVLVLVGALSAGIATSTGLASNLGFNPFWTDTFVAVVFVVLSLYWLWLTFQASKPDSDFGFVTPRSRSIRYDWRSKGVVQSAIITIIVFVVSLLFAHRPGELLLSPRWNMCGVIVSKCNPDFCYVPLDVRSRPLTSECIKPLDDSGYVERSQVHSTTYKPAFVKIQCSGDDVKISELPDSFFTPSCEGRIMSK